MERQSVRRGGFGTLALRAAAGASALGLLMAPAALAAPAPSPAFTPKQLRQLPTANWLTNGGNIYNHRYSPLKQINRDNVDQVKAVWRASLRGSGMHRQNSGQAQPLVYDGTMYVITGDDDVFAIDVESGDILWEYEAHLDPANVVTCCGWTSRGVGMGDGKIFVGQLDNKLIALDQKTGKVIWSNQTKQHGEGGYAINSAPLYYDGMVITGYAGADMGMRGEVSAFDADTGKKIWTFHTVPGPGEFGHDTWPQDNDVWTYGGASVWQTPAVDPELGLIYFAAGNPAPDLNGGVRAGDNLFSGSLLALDVHTGEYKWHYQFVHHDIWDYSAPNPVILFDAQIDGKMRHGLAQASKSGYLYILDRVTGEPLTPVEERPVPQNAMQKTAATQPIPLGDTVIPHRIEIEPEKYSVTNEGRTFTPFDTEPALYTPSAGVNWPPSSYDPERHLMFICANDSIGMARMDPNWSKPLVGKPYLGGSFGRLDAPRRGILAAMNLTNHKLAWRKQWTSGCSAGSTNTAGGLLFMGRGDGRVVAVDNSTGNTVWEFQVDAPVSGSVTVFEHKGVEYLAVLAGGSYYSPYKHGDGVWLFSLNGTMDPLDQSVIQPKGAQAADVTMPDGPADLARGAKLYAGTCLPCHGETGQGGHAEGAAIPTNLSASGVFAVATTGKGDMPSFAAMFKPDELRDIATYIVEKVIHQ